ncbi:hypothetical protein, partial [Bradyrhizobium sp.]|uniref:hypothetical protein n=1 Tax=Bradyrhizobium sp. TaxID=376 RepID=UPI0029013F0F
MDGGAASAFWPGSGCVRSSNVSAPTPKFATEVRKASATGSLATFGGKGTLEIHQFRRNASGRSGGNGAGKRIEIGFTQTRYPAHRACTGAGRNILNHHVGGVSEEVS